MTTENNRKPTNLQQLNFSLPNDYWVKAEITKEINNFLEFNEDEDTTYPNLWDTMKEGQRRNFIALCAFIQKLERSHTSSLIVHLQALGQKE